MKRFRVLLIVTISLRFLLAFGPHHPDLWNHMDWGERFFEYGARGFYMPDANVWDYTWPNQPIGTIYIYAFIWKLFNIIFNIFWKINITIPMFPSGIITFLEHNLYKSLLKLPSILGDFGIAYLIYKILKDWKGEKAGKLAGIIFLMNPVIWYNSAVWGQTDSVINFLALASFYYLNKKDYLKSILLFSLSIYIKVSLLIFTPIYLLALLKQRSEIKKIFIGGVLALVGIIVLTLPFSAEENPISFLYWLYSEKVLTQQLQVITANAFNLWGGLTGIEEQPHTKILLFMEYKYWGYLLFGIFWAPLVYKFYKTKDKEGLWWVLAMTGFSSFMFLTNMHERYLYPAFAYFTIMAVKNRKLMPAYVLISTINMINLYNIWWMPKVEIFVDALTLGGKILPRILSFVLVGVYLWVYREILRQLSDK